MLKPHEFIQAIRTGTPISWARFLRVMGKAGFAPGDLMRTLARASEYTDYGSVSILNPDQFAEIERAFPAPATVSDRIGAAAHGNL